MTHADRPSSEPKPMDQIVALCRRRGFIWQNSEIYGGINGFWDYGPLGAQLKRNLKDAWWRDLVDCPPDGPDGTPLSIVPVETTIIMHPKVWEASGHLAGFNDPMVDDRETKSRFRADKCWVVGFWTAEKYDELNKVYEQSLRYKQQFDKIGTEEFISKIREYAEAAKALLDVIEDDTNPYVTEDERNHYRELLEELFYGESENDPFSFAQELSSVLPRLRRPPMMVAVQGDSAEEAINNASAKLTRRQWKKLGENPRCEAYTTDDLPEYWDRLSPDTQRPTLTEPRQFNLMFDTYVGAVRDEESRSYLRPETAQGIFTQFWNVVDTSRVRVPFGIAQQGKAFRNEVTPRNFTFRSREFEQMEVEFFIPDPGVVGDDEARTREWYEYWRDLRYEWWQSVGLAGDNLQLREHEQDELAHYAQEGAGTSDVEYRFPFTSPGFGELEGIAHRTNYDLRQHAETVGKGEKMKYFDQQRGQHYFPHVIEPSAGADRGTLALLCEAYTPDESRPSKVYMDFAPRMAPIKAGVFPLVNKDGMPERAEKLYKQLRRRFPVQFDAKQNIGKRYARMDEAGTPFCFTVDNQTLEDGTVTVRHRDSQEQERISEDRVEAFLAEHIV